MGLKGWRLFSSLATPFSDALPRNARVSVAEHLPGKKGRGLLAASRGFEPGEVVLAEEPIVACGNAVAKAAGGLSLRGCVSQGSDLAQAALHETSAGKELVRVHADDENPRR